MRDPFGGDAKKQPGLILGLIWSIPLLTNEMKTSVSMGRLKMKLGVVLRTMGSLDCWRHHSVGIFRLSYPFLANEFLRSVEHLRYSADRSTLVSCRSPTLVAPISILLAKTQSFLLKHPNCSSIWLETIRNPPKPSENGKIILKMEAFNGKISIPKHQSYLFYGWPLAEAVHVAGVDGFAGPRDDLQVSHPANYPLMIYSNNGSMIVSYISLLIYHLLTIISLFIYIVYHL